VIDAPYDLEVRQLDVEIVQITEGVLDVLLEDANVLELGKLLLLWGVGLSVPLEELPNLLDLLDDWKEGLEDELEADVVQRVGFFDVRHLERANGLTCHPAQLRDQPILYQD
jgi:hypothetical protein